MTCGSVGSVQTSTPKKVACVSCANSNFGFLQVGGGDIDALAYVMQTLQALAMMGHCRYSDIMIMNACI